MATSVKIISDGVMKVDGGSMFGPVPKETWENSVATDRKNRMTLGLNCLLLQGGRPERPCGHRHRLQRHGGHRPRKLGLVPSRLLRGLKSVGLTPKDINAVVLSHLHFDHSGGCTRLDRAGNLVPTFTKAPVLRAAAVLA